MHDDMSSGITGRIVQRIRMDVRQHVDEMVGAMHKRLEAELESLGVHWHETSLHQFMREVRDQYLNKLVDDRVVRLLDRVVSDTPANTETAVEARIQVLSPKAGDTIAVTCDRMLTETQCDSIRAGVAEKLPEGVKVMVLSGGLKLAHVEAPRNDDPPPMTFRGYRPQGHVPPKPPPSPRTT